jgi:hypothetical protein
MGFEPTIPINVVSIVTGYRLDGMGIEYWWGQDFPNPSIPALRPTQPPVRAMSSGSLTGIKQPECGVDHPLHIVPRLKKM